MKRLLIIDDSAVVRKVAGRILQDQELEIAQAESGAVGMAMCREFRPDYLLLDATLPDQTSVEFLTAMRETFREAMPAVLLMVNELDIGPIMKAKRAGAAGHILKPFNRWQLTNAFSRFRATAESNASNDAA